MMGGFRKYKSYDWGDSENMKAERVNTDVFNFHQIKRRALFFFFGGGGEGDTRYIVCFAKYFNFAKI